MSTAGIYKLLVNDGKQDQILLATNALNERISRLKENRKMNGLAPEIDILDIEKTHFVPLNVHFKPFISIGFEYAKTRPDSGNSIPGGTVKFSIPQFGDFFNDMVLHLKLTGLSVRNAADKVKYCEFVGHRLMKKVTFTVNNNPLDEYGTEDYNGFYAIKVPTSKQVGWKRCVGQEVPSVGYLTNEPLVDEFREQKLFVNGPQTLKATHDTVEMWIPLLFWFNLDIGQSIPSVAIPFGQRSISVDFAKTEELAAFANYAGLPAPGAGFNPPRIENVELYINNIFVNPEIHDIYIKRIGFNLIRVRRFHETILNQPKTEVLLHNLKWPVEELYACVRPLANLSNMDVWNRNGTAVLNTVKVPVVTQNPVPNQIQIGNATYYTITPVVDSISLTASGTELYKESALGFFNAYLPLRYGWNNIVTPSDPGVIYIPFCVKPGEYQPSGYINLSRERRLVMNINGSTISNANQVILYVIATVLNFLLITDGSAVLRYTT